MMVPKHNVPQNNVLSSVIEVEGFDYTANIPMIKGCSQYLLSSAIFCIADGNVGGR